MWILVGLVLFLIWFGFILHKKWGLFKAKSILIHINSFMDRSYIQRVKSPESLIWLPQSLRIFIGGTSWRSDDKQRHCFNIICYSRPNSRLLFRSSTCFSEISNPKQYVFTFSSFPCLPTPKCLWNILWAAIDSYIIVFHFNHKGTKFTEIIVNKLIWLQLFYPLSSNKACMMIKIREMILLKSLSLSQSLLSHTQVRIYLCVCSRVLTRHRWIFSWV